MSTTDFITIIGFILGSSVVNTIITWLFKRFDAMKITPDDIKSLNNKIDVYGQHSKQADDEVKSLKLTVLRFMLFQTPHDQNSLEAQIQAGRAYSSAGGNGVGHIRINQLESEYKWRLKHNDWSFCATDELRPQLSDDILKEDHEKE